MSQTVTLLRGNETLPVFGGSPYWFVTMTGIGLPSVERVKERSPLQDGSTDVGYRLNDRLLNLVLLIDSTTLTSADQARDNLAEMLKPQVDNPIKIRVQRDDGKLRQIDGNVVGMVDFPNTEKERMWASQKVMIQFDCPDPVFYEPTLQSLLFDVETSINTFQVPIAVPFVYTSGSEIFATQIVNYSGKIAVKPTIYVTGPAEDLVITNLTTGKVLSLEGHTIADGDTYTLDLATRRIVDQNNVRKLSALTDDSNLFTWEIATTPIAAAGSNSIRVSVADQANENTSIRIEYYNRYPSI